MAESTNQNVMINTFSGGLNMDIDPLYVPDTQYVDALNIKLISNTDENSTGGITSINGVKAIDANDEVTLIGNVVQTTNIRDTVVVFTKDDDYNRVYSINIVTRNNKKYAQYNTIIRATQEVFPLTNHISTVTRWEDNDNVKVYFADGEQQIRVINIATTKIHKDDDPKYDNTSINKIYIKPCILFEELEFDGFGTGFLEVGQYQFAYQFFNKNANETQISPFTNLIAINNEYQNVTDISNETKRSIKLNLRLNEESIGFEYFRIIGIHYTDTTTLPRIGILYEASLSKQTSYSVELKQFTVKSILTIEELNAASNPAFVPKVLTTKNNYLIAGNIKYIDSTAINDYDSRAYRWYEDVNGVARTVLFSKSEPNNPITFTSEQLFNDQVIIPKTHDCINPFNDITRACNEFKEGGLIHHVFSSFVDSEEALLKVEKIGDFRYVIASNNFNLEVSRTSDNGTVLENIPLLKNIQYVIGGTTLTWYIHESHIPTHENIFVNPANNEQVKFTNYDERYDSSIKFLPYYKVYGNVQGATTNTDYVNWKCNKSLDSNNLKVESYGGTGKNISYHFVTAPIIEESQDSKWYVNDVLWYNYKQYSGATVDENYDNIYYSDRVQGKHKGFPQGSLQSLTYERPRVKGVVQEESDINNDSKYDINITNNNYIGCASEKIKYYCKSLQRDELYRFAIVFYDRFGNQSEAKWIGDIRTPSVIDNDFQSFEPNRTVITNRTTKETHNANVVVKPLHIVFEITPPNDENIVAFEIVYVERTYENRSKLAQGFLTKPLSSYIPLNSPWMPAPIPYCGINYLGRQNFGDIFEFFSPEVSFGTESTLSSIFNFKNKIELQKIVHSNVSNGGERINEEYKYDIGISLDRYNTKTTTAGTVQRVSGGGFFTINNSINVGPQACYIDNYGRYEDIANMERSSSVSEIIQGYNIGRILNLQNLSVDIKRSTGSTEPIEPIDRAIVEQVFGIKCTATAKTNIDGWSIALCNSGVNVFKEYIQSNRMRVVYPDYTQYDRDLRFTQLRSEFRDINYNYIFNPTYQFKWNDWQDSSTLESYPTTVLGSSHYTPLCGTQWCLPEMRLNESYGQRFRNHNMEKLTTQSNHGKCVIFKSPILQSGLINGVMDIFQTTKDKSTTRSNYIDLTYSGVLDTNPLSAWYMRNVSSLAIPIVNVVKLSNIYNHNSYSDRSYSKYISSGYFKIDKTKNKTKVLSRNFDTFITVFDCPKTTWNERAGNSAFWRNYPDNNGGGVAYYDNIKSHIDIDEGADAYPHGFANHYLTRIQIPLETAVDIYATDGEIPEYRNSPDFQTYASEIPTHGYSQKRNAFVYRDVFSQHPNIRFHSVSDIFSEVNKVVDVRVVRSEQKTNDEVFDSWTKFLPLNYLDVDTNYGSITNLRTFNNEVTFFQEHAVGKVSVNERSLITDENNESLLLGTGDALQRYDYHSTKYGMGENDLNAIVNTTTMLYFYDSDNKEVCVYSPSTGVQSLSKSKGVQSYMQYNVTREENPKLYYDSKLNDIIMDVNNKYPLIYNEKNQTFVSQTSIRPDHVATSGIDLLYLRNNTLYENDDKNFVNFYGDPLSCEVTVILNKMYPYVKVFDNTEFYGSFDQNNAYIEISANDAKQQGNEKCDSMRLYENRYRIPVPRNRKDAYTSRIRSTFAKYKFTYSGNNNIPLKINTIKTTFRTSQG